MSAMTKQARQEVLNDLSESLPKAFPAVEATDIEDVLHVAKQVASKHHGGNRYDHLVVEAMNNDGEDIIRVSTDDGDPVAHLPTEDPKVAEPLVVALKALRVPARLKSTKLAGCGGCDHYHPTDFGGDCRDDGNRFTTPNDSDDTSDRFDNGDPGTDLIDFEQTHPTTVYIDAKGGSVTDVRNLPDDWTWHVEGEDEGTPPAKAIRITVSPDNGVSVTNLPPGFNFEAYNLGQYEE